MTDDSPVGPTPIRGPGRPRKRRDATTRVEVADFAADDEVRNLKALKRRLSELLSSPDLHERDLASLSREYRAVATELHEAQLRKKASKLGSGRPRLHVVDRSLDGDI